MNTISCRRSPNSSVTKSSRWMRSYSNSFPIKYFAIWVDVIVPHHFPAVDIPNCRPAWLQYMAVSCRHASCVAPVHFCGANQQNPLLRKTPINGLMSLILFSYIPGTTIVPSISYGALSFSFKVPKSKVSLIGTGHWLKVDMIRWVLNGRLALYTKLTKPNASVLVSFRCFWFASSLWWSWLCEWLASVQVGSSHAAVAWWSWLWEWEWLASVHSDVWSWSLWEWEWDGSVHLISVHWLSVTTDSFSLSIDVDVPNNCCGKILPYSTGIISALSFNAVSTSFVTVCCSLVAISTLLINTMFAASTCSTNSSATLRRSLHSSTLSVVTQIGRSPITSHVM